ncbi:MAG: chitinase [Bacteroidetes bacterium]|nr:MAG: chitinase [Bacteroidota bacterium]
MKSYLLFSALALLSLFTLQFTPKKKSAKKVVIAYVFGSRRLVNPDSVDAEKLTHINYAFVNIKDGRAILQKPDTDAINLGRLIDLKKRNPDLKILISVGGWSWSKLFSDAALTDSSRALFAQSAASIVQQFNLDGIDIDWEYPGLRGDNNIFRPEDKENFTLMLQQLRAELNKLKDSTHKQYFLTAATAGFKAFIEHTELEKAQQYMDYYNVMTYDFKTEEAQFAGHHTNLYNSKFDPDGESADRAVQNYISIGVKPEKIVIGIAFYGRGWKTSGINNDGLGEKTISGVRGGGYTRLKDSIITAPGYIRYWDKKARAPYLFNQKDSIFITYDDEKSVKQKCRYVNKQDLAGVMFWEYFGDSKGYLLDAIKKNL